MKKQLSRYYFGRLNLIATYTNKHEYLLTSFNSSQNNHAREYSWNFFNVEEITFKNEAFIYGFLAKYRPKTEIEIADLSTHQSADSQIEDMIVAKSRFFLHSKTGLIAFHSVHHHIDKRTFVKRFQAVFEEGRTLVSASIETIEEERNRIFDALQKFDMILKVSIDLHPSNPNSKELWKDFDEHLQNMQATSYKELYQGKPENDGLNIKQNIEIKSKIAMAEDGYGKASVNGILEGKSKTISTSDNPVVIDSGNDDAEPISVLSVLWDVMDKLLRR